MSSKQTQKSRKDSSLKHSALITIAENLSTPSKIGLAVPNELQRDWPDIVRLSRKYVIITNDGEEPRVVSERDLPAVADEIMNEYVSMNTYEQKEYSRSPAKPKIEGKTIAQIVRALVTKTSGMVTHVIDLDYVVHVEDYDDSSDSD